jgi:hypothetical protein
MTHSATKSVIAIPRASGDFQSRGLRGCGAGTGSRPIGDSQFVTTNISSVVWSHKMPGSRPAFPCTLSALLIFATAVIIAGCAGPASKAGNLNALSEQSNAQAAPYRIATLWGLPKCSKFGSGERLVLKSGARKDLKPALDYFLRTHDLSECWFVDIFTDEKALAEFKREISPSAEPSSDAAEQMLTSDYVQLNNNTKTNERWYGVPVRLPNGRWEDKISKLGR